jgi:hypothetical protein
MYADPVIVAVPPKGGSLDDVLKKLVAVGWLTKDLVNELRRLVKDDKRRIKLEEGLISLWDAHGGDESATMRAADAAGHDLDEIGNALKRMRRWRDDAGVARLGFTPKDGVDRLLQQQRTGDELLTRQAAACLHLELDLTRGGSPSRLMFDHLEFTARIDGRLVAGLLVGTEHEVTPTYLRKHKRDLSLTCYDAFHNTLLDALDTGAVRNWRELMEHLIEANTDVRIVGSLGLDDYLGHFVLMPQSQADEAGRAGQGERRWGGTGDGKLAVLARKPVLIDAQYEEIYREVLGGDGIRFEASTHDVENQVVKQQRPAIYIVRSGSTIAMTDGLCVVGEELITSETIVAVNRERLEHNPGVARLLESLQPQREDRSGAWRTRLAERLGKKLR